MTRRYTNRGLWIVEHGEEAKQLWRETKMTAQQIADRFGVNKGAVSGFLSRQSDIDSRARVSRAVNRSVKKYMSFAVDDLDTDHIDADLAEVSQYRHDTARMLSCLARLSGLSVEGLTSRDRSNAKLKLRAAYLMRRLGLSYPRIGQLMNRDHSTAQYRAKRFQATIKANRAEAMERFGAEAVRAEVAR